MDDCLPNCCRPPTHFIDLDRWSDEIDASMNEDTTFIYQVLEGIKFAAQVGKPLKVKKGRMEKIEMTLHISSPSSRHGGKVVMKDYAPAVFKDIRQSDGILTEDYVRSWTYSPLSIPKPDTGAGRSGSLFFFSADKRFLFKSLPAHEVKTLQHILFDYRSHLMRNPQSRLMRFLALHRFKLGKKWWYLIVANNFFHAPAGLEVSLRYDLKGRVPKKSSLKKEATKRPAKGLIWKDNQIGNTRFYPENSDKLLETLKEDAAFLRSQNCIDYSLLVGVHEMTAESHQLLAAHREREERIKSEAGSPPQSPKDKKEEVNGGGTSGGGGPSFNEVEEKAWRRLYASRTRVYYFGMIDFLSRYHFKKKAAHFFKSFLWTDETLSTVPPDFYYQRWTDFLDTIIFPAEMDIGPADVQSATQSAQRRGLSSNNLDQGSGELVDGAEEGDGADDNRNGNLLNSEVPPSDEVVEAF